MRNNISVIILFSVIPLFIISGCVSTGTVPEGKKVQYYKPPAISNGLLENRIDVLKNLLKENVLSDEKKDTAISVLKAYEKLRSLNKGNTTEKEYRKTVQLLFKNLETVEQLYFNSENMAGNAFGEKIIEDYSAVKKQIFEDYYAGNFNGVISGCDELVSRFGKSGLTPDLGIIFVEALLKNNMTSKALSLATSILGAEETRPDIISLLADAIELELKTGNMDDAKKLYEKLVDNINERYSIYQRTGKLISEYENDGTIVDESVKKKISEISPEKTIQIQQLIDNIEQLIAKKDFSGARVALIRWRLNAEEGPEVEIYDRLQKSVDKAEEQFDRENSNDKIKIDDAKKLIEQEKYEEALDILDPIVTAGGNYEAEKIQKDAIEKLIIRDKNVAAKLKIAANQERDIQRKRDLLIKSRSILQNLIDKYPASPLLETSKRNILKIDNELMELNNTND